MQSPEGESDDESDSPSFDEPEDDDAEIEADDGSGDEVDDESETDESETDGDEQEVEVGMRIVASTKKGEEPGEIIEIIEDEGKCRVKLDTGRTIRIGIEKLQAEPLKTPPKKSRRKR